MPIDNGNNLFEKQIKKLVQLVSDKAQTASMTTTKNAWANYIEDNSDLKSRTFIRMYDRYVLNDLSQSVPSSFSLNAASKFIGYESFAVFCKDNFSVEGNSKSDQKLITKEIFESQINSKSNSFQNRMIRWGTFLAMGIGGIVGINFLNQPQCMYWNENEFLKISCKEIQHPNVEILPFNDKDYKYLKKIEVSDTTEFFKNGIPQIWYSKTKGEIEYFSSDGEHPITGKRLNPITTYIVNKYVLSLE